MANLVGRSVGFSVVLSALFASAVALFVTVWEWMENPGGIFRGADGTNWGFVGDTAVSWFVPTFAWFVVPVLAVNLAWQWFRCRRQSRKK